MSSSSSSNSSNSSNLSQLIQSIQENHRTYGNPQLMSTDVSVIIRRLYDTVLYLNNEKKNLLQDLASHKTYISALEEKKKFTTRITTRIRTKIRTIKTKIRRKRVPNK